MKKLSILKLSLFLLSFPSLSYSQSCLEIGKSVGVNPNAPKCCPGLVLEPAPEGTLGKAGTCVESKGKSCIETGKSVGVGPNAPKCCPGLVLEPAPEGTLGKAGNCVESKGKSCIGEGKPFVAGGLNLALKCCPGLEAKPQKDGIFGGSTVCEKGTDAELNGCQFTSPSEILCPDGKVYVYTRKYYNSVNRLNTKSDIPTKKSENKKEIKDQSANEQ